MISEYTLLRFLKLDDFIDYLKGQDIHRYGLTTFAHNDRTVIADDHNKPMTVQMVSVAWRLSAKDPANHEIVLLDLQFYRDVYVTAAHTRQECEKPMKEALDFINKTFKQKMGDYKVLDRIDAEFKVVSEE